MTSTDLFIYTVVLIAGVVHGLLGIGFPMVATPMVAMAGDVRNAIIILLLPTMAINLVNIWRGGNWRKSIGRYWPLAAYGIMGSLLGTQLLVITHPAPYKALMAVIICLYLNADHIGIRLKWVHRHVQLGCAVFGLLGGFLAGTVNVMLPALIIFALELRLPPTVAVQLFNFCFLLGKIGQGTVLISHGLVGVEQLRQSVILILLALTALAVGLHFRDIINPETYRRWLRRGLALIAIMLTLQFFQFI